MDKGEAFEVKDGLQIWTPDLTFKEPQNLIAFEETLPELSSVDVKVDKANGDLYCTGIGSTWNKIAYHLVNEQEVAEERARMRVFGTDNVSCVMKDIILTKSTIPEEARVRNLHRGLARTCMFLAADATGANEFRGALTDLTKLFNMLQIPIHDVDDLRFPAPHGTGLVYMVARAGRKHKAMRDEEASALVNAMNKGIIERKDSFWSKTSMESLKGAITSKDYIPRHNPARTQPKSLSKASANKAQRGDDVSVLVYQSPPTPETKTRKTAPPISPQKRFLLDIDDAKRLDDTESKIERLHKRYCGNDADKIIIHFKKDGIKTGYNGVLAYFGMRATSPRDLPKILEGYLMPLTNVRKRDMDRVLAAANLLTAKLNFNGTFDPPKKLPGMHPEAVPDAFKMLRRIVSQPPVGQREKKHQKMFGDIVEKYLRTLYSEIDYED